MGISKASWSRQPIAAPACADPGGLHRPWSRPDHFCCVPGHAVRGDPPAAYICWPGWERGSVASVSGYYLFGHVRTRVNRHGGIHLQLYDSGGYQVAPVAVCDRDRRLAWNGTFVRDQPDEYPGQRLQILFFRRLRKSWDSYSPCV